MYPRYRYPARLLLSLVRDALLGRRRRFSEDARACIAALTPPLRAEGLEHIPARGCFVITPNHYYRPGFGSQWSALAISAVLTREVRWVMAAELTFPGSWIAPLGMPASRFVLGRVARTYAFTAMPPMPPRAREVEARAAAVREVLHYARHTPGAVLAVAPEGGDQPGGRLSMPPQGGGRFALLLAAAGLSMVPTGVFEQGGQLVIRFGAPYRLALPAATPAAEKDTAAARILMSRIAPLLPADLQGEFAAPLDAPQG